MAIDPLLATFQLQLDRLDDKRVLDLAEQAGNPQAAYAAISNETGYSAMGTNTVANSFIATRLISLRPVAQAKYYNWYF